MKTRGLKQCVIMAAAGGILLVSGLHSESADPMVIKSIIQNDEVPETDLLLHMDKQGRAMYYSLDSDGKKLARKLAAQNLRNDVLAIQKGYKEAVQAAVEQSAEKRLTTQERRMHNGMDRLPIK